MKKNNHRKSNRKRIQNNSNCKKFVVFLKNDKSNDKHSKRTQILDRDGWRCQICRNITKRMEVHHIVPKSHGGGNNLNNMVTLCHSCHTKIHKGEINPIFKRKKQKPPVIGGYTF